MTLRAMIPLPPPTNSDEFESMVQDVLRIRQGNPHLVRYGRSGQRQHGIDGFDPLAGRREGLVWQSTLTGKNLLRKLVTDLKSMDNEKLTPDLFVFAVGSERDVGLQANVKRLTEDRLNQGLCPVEVLFWSEVRETILNNGSLGSKWYPELFPGWQLPAQSQLSLKSSSPPPPPQTSQLPAKQSEL